MTLAAPLDVGELPGLPAAANRRRRVFWIIIGVATATGGVLCGWAIYLNLHAAIGERAFLFAILFAFAPVIPLSAVFLLLDRLRPEPPWLLLAALVWGATGAAFGALSLNQWLVTLVGDRYGATARGAVFIAPWVEEPAKALVVFVIVYWRRHRFNSAVAGVVYGGLAGIGFAFTENIVYYGQQFQLVQNYAGDKSAALAAVESLFMWRGVAAPFVHPMFTMLTGLGIGIAVRNRNPGVRILAPVAGFCAAVLLHMGYNTIASFGRHGSLTPLYLVILLPTLLAVVALVLAVRRYEDRVLAARLGDYAAFGWLPRAYLAFIVTGNGRRAARRYARSLEAEHRDVLRQFQRTGLELGLLRDRVVRGVVDHSELQRERELLTAMRLLRAQVRLPPPAPAAGADPSEVASSW